MQELLDNIDLRDLVDPFALDIINENVAEEIRRNRKKDSAIETLHYLRTNGIPLEEVLYLSKKLGNELKAKR